MRLERHSPCKVNFFLNILGKRADGFHELETIMHPVGVCDLLAFESGKGSGVELSCSDKSLPTDSTNLVHRAAMAFLKAAGISEGVCIHLEKRIPVAAGLGGGSGNAAHTLLGLNELFRNPLSTDQLFKLGASLGSDVPFFFQPGPALAQGRGERITSLPSFPALRGAHLFLVYPGFGIATAWAYHQLAQFPSAISGQPGRAQDLISLLQGCDLHAAAPNFYNALEAPALKKYPLLAIYQEFLRERGAPVTLMSGSGSATFAILPNENLARIIEDQFRAKFGSTCWTATVGL